MSDDVLPDKFFDDWKVGAEPFDAVYVIAPEPRGRTVFEQRNVLIFNGAQIAA